MITLCEEKFRPLNERWRENKSIAHTRVIQAVAEHFEIQVDSITSGRQYEELCLCRAIIYKILYRYTKSTQEEIGKIFDKDRTTVIHGIRVLTYEMKIYPEKKHHYETIEKKILSE